MTGARALPTLVLVLATAASVHAAPADGRERLRLDRGWRFALGHASDPLRDFGHGTGYFSYLAKTGFGDGPASPFFDDRFPPIPFYSGTPWFLPVVGAFYRMKDWIQ